MSLDCWEYEKFLKLNDESINSIPATGCIRQGYCKDSNFEVSGYNLNTKSSTKTGNAQHVKMVHGRIILSLLVAPWISGVIQGLGSILWNLDGLLGHP